MGMPCLNRSSVKNIGILIIGREAERGIINYVKKTEYKKKMELIFFIIEARLLRVN